MLADGMSALGNGHRTILMIEDDEHVRQLSAAMLERAGFEVLQAQDGSEAVEIWERHNRAIDLLLANIVVPGWNGREVAQDFLSARPDLKVIFTSGHDQQAVANTTRLIKGARFLRKPYGGTVLIDTVRASFQ